MKKLQHDEVRTTIHAPKPFKPGDIKVSFRQQVINMNHKIIGSIIVEKPWVSIHKMMRERNQLLQDYEQVILDDMARLKSYGNF